MPPTRQRRIVRRAVMALAGMVLLICGCKPPPDTDKAVDAIKESTTSGARLAKDAAETAQDPEKRQRAMDQMKRDLENPPRQFK